MRRSVVVATEIDGDMPIKQRAGVKRGQRCVRIWIQRRAGVNESDG